MYLQHGHAALEAQLIDTCESMTMFESKDFFLQAIKLSHVNRDISA